MESLTPAGLRTTPAEPSSTAAKCPSLPTEIWRIIFSVGEFDEHGGFWSTYDHATMASICRSCTVFRDLIRPRLYCNFNSHVLTDKWHWISVAKFARTVCTNPRLASMVRRVDIRGVCDMKHMWAPSTPVSMDNPDHPMARVLIRRATELRIGLKYYQIYSKKLSEEVHAGFTGFDLVSLVLAQLPLMHTLHLYWFDIPSEQSILLPRGGWPWSRSLRSMFLRPCGSSDPIVQHRLGYPAEITLGYSFGSVLPLLWGGRGPTRLSIVNSNGPRIILSLDNMRELILDSCQFRPGNLLNLLRHCRHLCKFVFRGAGHTRPLPSHEFMEALEPAHASLEVLGIDLQSFESDNGARISSLKHFTALKTLYIDLNCVWDWEAATNKDSPPGPDKLFTTLLPDSIEDVALFSGDTNDEFLGFRVEAHVRGLQLERQEKGAFPHLKRLRGKGFSPLNLGLFDDHETECRMATLNEATRQLGDDGVEVVFDEQGKSDLDFGYIISHY